ncbi:unnamed protein product [Nezara viridula]|uniref:Neuropeptide n=1 Tax=Nezara viridula TaxID=85310 RepID=A0A9P0HAG0_NEZVI|nr:unnamed protein product [Nezara viridula]
MPFAAVAVLLLLMATLAALIGHCNNDHKTLIACALYTLAGKDFVNKISLVLWIYKSNRSRSHRQLYPNSITITPNIGDIVDLERYGGRDI